MSDLETIVQQAVDGDAGAFRTIVQRFQDMAVGYAFSILGDFHLAEDAAQEAFLTAYLSLRKLQKPGAFPGWFRKIVFTNCSRFTRGKLPETVSLENTIEVVSHRPDPYEEVESREMNDVIRKAIQDLPEHERQVTALFYISDYSQREIGAFLDVPVSTVKKRIYDARKRMKERLIDMVKDALQEQAPSSDDRFVRRFEEDVSLWDWGGEAIQYYDRQVRELMEGHQAGLRFAVRFLNENLPRLKDAEQDKILDVDITVTEARQAIAQEKGFVTWSKLIRRSEVLGKRRQPKELDSKAQAVFEAVQSGNINALKRLIDEEPTLIREVLDNRTLLEYAVHSQPDVDENTAVKMVDILIEVGSALGPALNYAMYDRPKIMEALIRKGALNTGKTAGLLALKSAVLHGYYGLPGYSGPLLVKHGIQPEGFWMAAGIGDLDRVKSYFNHDGQLKSEAADYRPNLADIGWHEGVGRSDDSQEVLEEAFCMACFNGQLDVSEFLLDRGARVDAMPPGLGKMLTPLHFALFREQGQVAKLLVVRGSDLTIRDGQYGGSPLIHAIHCGDPDLVEFLLEHGGDPNDKTKNRESALSFAVKLKHQDVAQVLRKHGASASS